MNVIKTIEGFIIIGNDEVGVQFLIKMDACRYITETYPQRCNFSHYDRKEEPYTFYYLHNC